jgi:hypothetical protein
MRSVQLLPTYVEVVTASGTVLRRSRRRRRLFTNTQTQLLLDCEVALATAERKPPKELLLVSGGCMCEGRCERKITYRR